MNSTKRKEYTLLVILLAAMSGIMPFAGSGCTELMVVDTDTGELRPATEEETAAIIEQVGDVGKIISVSTGHPEFLPFVDLGTRLALIVAAFMYKRKIGIGTGTPPATRIAEDE